MTATRILRPQLGAVLAIATLSNRSRETIGECRDVTTTKANGGDVETVVL